MKPLISVTYLSSFLPIRPGNSSFDSKLMSIINGVTAEVEQACNRSFDKQVHTEFVNSRQTRGAQYDFAGESDQGVIPVHVEQTIRLRATPVDTGVAVSVYYDPNRVFGEDTKLAATSLFISSDEIIISHPMRACKKAIKLVYTAGYGTGLTDEESLEDVIPADLRLAVVKQCMHAWAKASPENVSVDRDESSGDGDGARFSVKGGFLPDVSLVLANYKRVLTGNG